eukprot:1194306-Prorocentrum_minimum.AAC.3
MDYNLLRVSGWARADGRGALRGGFGEADWWRGPGGGGGGGVGGGLFGGLRAVRSGGARGAGMLRRALRRLRLRQGATANEQNSPKPCLFCSPAYDATVSTQSLTSSSHQPAS